MQKRAVLICVEGSHSKGLGHVYRSLRLARALRTAGISSFFVANDDITSCNILRMEGFEVFIAPVGEKDGQWERDLLAQRQINLWWNDRLDTTLAHAQALPPELPRIHMDDAGAGLLGATAVVLTMPCHFTVARKAPCPAFVGLEYMLLEENLGLSKYVRKEDKQWRILVSMGGSDTWGGSIFVLRCLAHARWQDRLSITLITGAGYSHENQLRPLLAAHPAWRRKACVPDMATEFLQSDLLICTGGMTPFEAAATGLPACIVASEPHEEANAAFLEQQGAGFVGGRRKGNYFEGNVILVMERSLSSLENISKKAGTLCDGMGCSRCINIIKGILHA